MPRKYVIYDRLNRPKLEYPKQTTDYIEYEIHQEKKSTGAGVDDFELVDVETEIRTNIDEFINSFKDTCGIEAIMKKMALTGDVTLLNEKEPQFMDTTIIPEDPTEAFKMANSVEEAYNKIDTELTEGKSMEDFIKDLSPEKLQKYIDKKVAERMKKEGNTNNESN